MTNPATAAGPAPASKNLLARIIGVITTPRETFQGIAAHPKWFGMLAAATLVVALFTALPLSTDAGRQAAIDKQVSQMQSFGFQVNDQMYEQMQKGAARLPYTTAAGVIILSPIFAVIVAGILFAVFNAALGGEASFKQVFAIQAHAGAISMLSAIFSGGINYFRQRMDSVTNLG